MKTTTKPPGRTPRKGAQRGGRPRKRAKKRTEVFSFSRLRWDTPAHGRASMVRMLRAFDDGELAEGKYKTMVYGSRAIGYWAELERQDRQEQKWDERFRVLEQQIEALARRGIVDGR